MFTGLIEEIGVVDRIHRGSTSAHIKIKCAAVLDDIHIGDSIAVNGVCLTATNVSRDSFEADVMEETIRRSSLSGLGSGHLVNLERAMPMGGRFGGHIVAGHVDGIGRIVSIKNEEMAVVFRISAKELMRYIVPKGSIAVDGISLTVANVDSDTFSISIIPHTISNTTLKDKAVGDIVNLETDIIGKYVESLIIGKSTADNAATLSGQPTAETAGTLSGDYELARAFLEKNGF